MTFNMPSANAHLTIDPSTYNPPAVGKYTWSARSTYGGYYKWTLHDPDGQREFVMGRTGAHIQVVQRREITYQTGKNNGWSIEARVPSDGNDILCVYTDAIAGVTSSFANLVDGEWRMYSSVSRMGDVTTVKMKGMDSMIHLDGRVDIVGSKMADGDIGPMYETGFPATVEVSIGLTIPMSREADFKPNLTIACKTVTVVGRSTRTIVIGDMMEVTYDPHTNTVVRYNMLNGYKIKAPKPRDAAGADAAGDRHKSKRDVA